MEVVVFVTVVCYAADSTGVPDVVCVNILIFTWTKLDESSKLPSRGGGGERGTPIHYLYGYVPPNGVVILKLLI